MSSLPGEAIAPVFEDLDTEHRYSTVAGVYAFPKAAPFLMRHESAAGEVFVSASTFVVLPPGLPRLGQVELVNASTYRHEIRYPVTQLGNVVGNVTITFDFKDDGPPKVTAVVNQSSGSPLSIAWVSFTLDRVAFNGTATVDFSDLPVPLRLETQSRRVHVGPTSDTLNWSRRLLLDWSDAGAGLAFVGPFSAGDLNGTAIFVVFPQGTTVVDPIVVGTSTSMAGTDFTIQRKAFTHGERTWVFWYDGTDIVYASSQFTYASSQNTLIWTAKVYTGAGAVGRGFDVDQRDGTVLVGYVPSALTSMKILKGTITGSIITWSGPYTVASWSTTEAGVPSVAIGTDGYYWAAFVLKTLSSAVVEVQRSTDAGATTFFQSTVDFLVGAPAENAARILALPNGGAYLLVVPKSDLYIRGYRYDTAGWGPQTDYDLGHVRSSSSPGDVVSAVALPNGDIRLAYLCTLQKLCATTIAASGSASTVTLDSRMTWYPTITQDANGDSHVLYGYIDTPGGVAQYHILYQRTQPFTDSWTASADEPIGYSVFNRRSHTAAPFSAGRVALVWMEENPSPYSVMFGAIPTPMDLGSQTGQPWNRQGISPYQSYFRQLSEHVSPGSGLLTVKQTDLVLPGRNLNLEISRLYTTPRAFTSVSSAPAPYLYEENLDFNVGKVWQLNFPWLTDQYLHLWDGQMYVVKWNGDQFENDDGEHFVLYRSCPHACQYYLSTKSGVTYLFNAQHQLVWIADSTDSNLITFTYGSDGISEIADTIGRKVTFAYNADGTIQSITSGPRTVAYSYQSVGGLTLLSSVRDSLNRATQYEHTDPRNAYLLTAVKYPTGAKSAYAWSNPAVAIGSDLQAYYVTRQEALNSAFLSIRANTFDYTVVNGRVSYVKVTTYDAGIVKGSTTQLFDSIAGRSTTIRRDAAGAQLNRDVTWFSRGAIGQVDFYSGASTTPSYSTNAAYDEWDNVIYSRDAVGHERFASYVNTRFQGGFFAAGRLTRTASGLQFQDDFEDRDLSDWTTSGSATLDFTVFESAPPTLRVQATSTSTTATALHAFAAQSSGFWIEAVIKASEATRDHHVRVQAGSTIQIELRFASTGQLQRKSGPSSWTDVMAYSADQWYHIAIYADPSAGASGSYSLYVNGVIKGSGLSMLEAGNPDRLEFRAVSCSSCGTSTFHVDVLKVWKSSTITVTGLEAKQFVEFYDALGRKQGRWKAPDAGGSVSMTLSSQSGVFSIGTVVVYDSEGIWEFTSQSREFWGGDTWAYTRPWKAFPGRSRTGFLRATTIYVEDSVPSNHQGTSGDTWDWGSYDFPPSGASSHRSAYFTQGHEHYFFDASLVPTVNSGNYLIQYIFVPDNQYPSEIMLSFQDSQTSSWEHRAYWGMERLCGNLFTCGTAPASMGSLPGMSGRWLMLIVKADNVAMNGKGLEGVRYSLYGGRATWDFTAIGDSQTGEIRISGLQSQWTAELYDPQGVSVASGSAGSGTEAAIDVYSSVRKVRAFPFEGYFVVKDDSGGAVYRSPVMSFWGGDTYNYGGTAFYPNADVDPSIRDRVAATLEFQTGRGASTWILQDRLFRYTSNGLLDLLKFSERAPDGTATWRTTSLTYDATTGLPMSVTDPLSNRVTYGYSPTYGQAYVTTVTDDLGNSGRYTYDPTTGWLLSSKNARGYRTRYAYDLVGRPTNESHFDLPASSEVLYFDMECTSEEATPRMEDLSGNGNHGTISGTTAVGGKVGYARDFAGSGNRIESADSSSLDVSGNKITLAAWVYPKSSSSSNIILNKESTYEIAINNGIFQAAVETPASGFWAWGGSKPVPLNTWTHVAFVYDDSEQSTSKWKFYLNGVLQESIAPAGGQTGNIVPSSYALRIGDRSAFVTPFVGTIDEVRVFNRALAASEITSLYDNTFELLSSSGIAFDDSANIMTLYEPTTKPRLVYLDMETLLSSKLEDFAGHGSHGVMSGTTPGTGKVGGARDFNGAADFVELGDAPWLDATTALTVSMWINHDYNSNPSDIKGLFFKGADTGASRNYNGHLTTSRKLEMQWGDGTTVYTLTGATALTDRTRWYHVAFVFDWAGDSFKIYVDGAEDAPTTSTGGVVTNAGKLVIGKVSESSASGRFFDGMIDEVQLFDRALSASEIAALAQRTEKGSYQRAYFDSLGRVTKSVRRDLYGSLVSWSTNAYNFRDQIVSTTVARDSSTSFTTTYEYDFLGRPTKITYPGSAVATIAYDDVNRIRTAIAENGRKAQYLYDLGGRTTAVREYYDPLSYYTTSYWYDEVGNLLTVTNPLSQVTSHEYDNLNRLTKTTYADGKYEAYTYDAVGNLKTRKDRALQVTRYVYDDLYRLDLICYLDAVCDQTTKDVEFDYDANGNPVRVVTNPSNPTTTVAYVYDGLDRVNTETETIGGTSHPVDYLYDPAGRVTQLTYPADADNTRRSVSYVYDAVGRPYQVMDTSTTFATFSYFADDLTKDVTFGNNVVQSYAYNGRAWPTSIKATHTSGSTTTTYLDLAYTYDTSGNVLSMGSASFTYDRLDRLKTAMGGFGSQFYDYDALGNRLRLDAVFLRPSAAGSSSQWTRSGCTQSNYKCVKETSADGDTSFVYTSTAGYQDLYAMDDLSVAGTINAVTVTAVARAESSTSCDPNCYGAIQLRLGGSVSGGSSSKYVGTAYQAVSQTWTTKPGGGSWTDADVDGLQAGVQLVAGGTASTVRVTQLFVTVNVGDSVAYTYAAGPSGMNTLDSLVKSGATTSFTYDANGNLDTKTGGWDYDWNVENLMALVKQNGAQQQAYTYDGLGRRVKIDGTPSSTWTVSIFSGMDAIFEKDQSGAVTKYVYANSMRIAKITSTSAVQYYLGDHLGSTRKILDASRGEIASFDYNPFGKPTPLTSPEAYRYTSEKHDDPTGFVYLRARQYDPDLGRFVSADPVLGSLSAPQTLNRYTYGVNNPLRYVDPTGLKGCHPDNEECVLEGEAEYEYWGECGSMGCEGWESLRAWGDAFFTAVGVVPVLGDVLSTGWFVSWDLIDCATVGCDWTAMGLDLLGVAPFVPNLGGMARVGGRAFGLFGGMAIVGRTANRADAAVDVLRAGNRAHDTLLAGYRTVFQRMGLTENVDFFINKGIRFADNPSKIVRGSGRPDILLRLVGPQTGNGVGIALEIKSQLTRAGRYAEQLLDYERALMRAGYGSYAVRVILY